VTCSLDRSGAVERVYRDRAKVSRRGCEATYIPDLSGLVPSLRNQPAQEAKVRSFITLLVTEIDFVDGGSDTATDRFAQGYEEHLMEVVQEAAQKLSLRTVQGNRVAKLQVAEIKGVVSL